MLKKFKGDLHIHTCLSPCGEKEMRAVKIAKEAKEKGVDFIGISDHNSAENVESIKKVADKYRIKVIGGIEITSEEEVHILGFFDNNSSLLKMQEIIYDNLEGKNDSELFGEQIIIDEDDEIIGINNKLLIGATKLRLKEIVDKIHQFNGLAIASHIDREAFSIISQLGFIPEDIGLDAVEVSSKSKIQSLKTQISNLPVVSFSDAHRIEEIGRNTTDFILEEVSISEIKKALLHQKGREVIL